MIRKAKREGKPLDFYVKQGLDKPSRTICGSSAPSKMKRRGSRRGTRSTAHCIAFHLSSCKRDDSCAFLHDAVVEF